MIAAAETLAAHGLALFPVARDCRQPLTAHGYKDASKAPETLRRWWRHWPHANMAVACGAVSGVCVVDVDVKASNGLRTLAELQSVHGNLPRTWRTRTPSGGVHLWFRQPARELRNRVNFAPGLDCRTDGGSVAVPPSRKANGVYRWEIAAWDGPLADAPDWLLNLIDPPPVPRPPLRPLRFATYDRAARYVAAVVNGECSELAVTRVGGRNHRLFQASARIGELIGAGLCSADLAESELAAAAVACGLVRDDGRHAVLATINSGLARGAAHPREVSL